jgi:hypothetical protein
MTCAAVENALLCSAVPGLMSTDECNPVPLQFDESERRSKRGSRVQGKGDVEGDGGAILGSRQVDMLQTRFQNVAQRCWRNAEFKCARFDPWLNANTRKMSTTVLQKRSGGRLLKGLCKESSYADSKAGALSPNKHPANNHRRKE